jgi:radial spoke head protein 3
VTELTDKAPMYEIACQTSFNVPVVPTPWAMPQLRGASKKTLVEDNELFLFEDEVEPLLSVLCGKTLEQARMEVLEEEELAEMKRKQAQLENLNKLEVADIKRLEEEEAFRLKTHEAKKNLQRQKRATQKLAHEKMVSRSIAKGYLGTLRQNSYNQLSDVNYFYSKYTEVTLKTDVLPWLFDETEAFLEELNANENLP